MAWASGPPRFRSAWAGGLGPTSCDVSADPAIGQGAEVGLAAVTGIGGSFLGLTAEVVFDPVHQRNELVLIAHALRQAVRHDDLGFCIDGGLRVVALDVAVLGQKHAALGIGEVSLRLALGLLFRRRGRLAVLL